MSPPASQHHKEPIPNLPTTVDRSTLAEFHRFLAFYEQIIRPNQPSDFVHLSGFHHGLMYTACEQISATGAPRGFLKSEIFSRYRVLHRLVDPTPGLTGEKPVDYLIVSETLRFAETHLSWIKSEIKTNPHLLRRYGDLTLPNLKWNENEIQLKNGSRCNVMGYGSQLRGRHPTDIVTDDIESLNNMATKESLEKLKDWFYRVLMGTMVPETRFHVIGTVIARECLLLELLENPEFKGRIWKALSKDEESLWPERYPVTMLQKLRQRIGSHRFNAEYQNEPLGLADQIIPLEWIRRHQATDLTHLTFIRKYIGVDPAFTEERWGDYSGITVLGETEDHRLYEILSWRKKVALPELRDTIILLAKHHSDVPLRLGIEEVAAQKVVRQAIQEKEPHLAITPLRPDADKPRRLISVSRLFEMGIVSLMTESFVEELLNFPHGDRDRVDSLVWALKMYEQENPVVAPPRKQEVSLLHLDPTSMSIYLERNEMGHPMYLLPEEVRMSRHEVIMINELADDLGMW